MKPAIFASKVVKSSISLALNVVTLVRLMFDAAAFNVFNLETSCVALSEGVKVIVFSFFAVEPWKPVKKLLKTLLTRKAVVSPLIATISETAPVTVFRSLALIPRTVPAFICFNCAAVAEAFNVRSRALVEDAVNVANSVLVSVLTISANRA